MDMGDRRENGKVTTREKAIGAPFWLTDDTQILAQTEVWAITDVREIPRRVAVGTRVTPRPPPRSVRAPLCIRLLPRVFDGELAVCVPAPVTHFPGPEPGACFADPHSPWSPVSYTHLTLPTIYSV